MAHNNGNDDQHADFAVLKLLGKLISLVII